MPVALIDPFDIGAVAARALTEDGHDGRSYRLTGPRAMLAAERVAVAADVLARDRVSRRWPTSRLVADVRAQAAHWRRVLRVLSRQGHRATGGERRPSCSAGRSANSRRAWFTAATGAGKPSPLRRGFPLVGQVHAAVIHRGADVPGRPFDGGQPADDGNDRSVFADGLACSREVSGVLGGLRGLGLGMPGSCWRDTAGLSSSGCVVAVVPLSLMVAQATLRRGF